MLLCSLNDSLPEHLYTAQQVRDIDRLAIESLGGDGYALMRRAGKAAFRHLQRQAPDCRRLSVFCGGGNNGGDGYVIAELAVSAGMQVTLYALSAPEKLRGEAAEAWQKARAAGVEVTPWQPDTVIEADLVVDALLGTGLSGAVRDDYAQAIEAINASGSAIQAIDIPSGLNADTGMPLGPVVEADFTSTFIGIKRGLTTGKAAHYVGTLWFDGLDVPAEILEKVGSSLLRDNLADLRQSLPQRPADAHKGLFGRVVVVGGDLGFGGAAIMASEAACRSGAGLVSCVTREPHVIAGLARLPEVMFRQAEHRSVLQQLLAPAEVVVLGPGLGQGPWGQMCFQTSLQLCREQQISLVVDADGLNLLAQTAERLPPGSVITPHPGEAARLLGTSVAEVMRDRFAAAAELAQRYACVALLKGAGTVIASAGDDGVLRQSVMFEHGNSGMAAGGMGDVLSGIIGAVIAQGADAFAGARLAAAWHASAADVALQHECLQSLVATDVSASLGSAWKQECWQE